MSIPRGDTRGFATLPRVLVAVWFALCSQFARADTTIDLTRATIVVREANIAPLAERTAAAVLMEETEKRSGVRWKIATKFPSEGWAIVVLSGKDSIFWEVSIPGRARTKKAEGYGIATEASGPNTDISTEAFPYLISAGSKNPQALPFVRPNQPILWIYGADARGALFGVGRVLRNLAFSKGSVRLPAPFNLVSSPDYPIRGHQLGYRAQANSYDAWTPAQFDQYIRELALFGSNSVEGIPFQDDRPTVNAYPRAKMNVDISRSCERYGQDYWLWAPADFDLKNATLRAKALREHESLFRDCPTLTGVFVAGGDPGDNAAELVIPYLADLSRLLARHHPKAKVWLSMQGYSPAQQDDVYLWIERNRPVWLGGLVAGPSSPPLMELRARLPKQYPIRDYPDITHNVRCQFPVPYWDPALSFTLGRESANPRPLFFQRVIQDTAPFTEGFISYSDGIHDDVNKIVWSALTWDKSANINVVLTEYCRLFFGEEVAESAAAGIFAFERNWEGSLANNGGVDATFALWRGLEERSPNLRANWRWQMCLLRAYYDMYTRKRLGYESDLEAEANAQMLTSRTIGSEKATEQALQTLKRAETAPIRPELNAKIAQLCDDLYKSIGLQSSMAKYHACSAERGCVLDFVNYPLNNRWWLEDEMAKVKKMVTEREKVARLESLAKWETPGSGSFYDDIGNIAKSPREVRNERVAAPLLDVDNAALPGLMFWIGNNALARSRQSWFSDAGFFTVLKYVALDPQSDYVVRTTGYGDCPLKVNGVRLAPTLNGRRIGEIKEFSVPRGLYRDGAITLTFDPAFEPTLNWREQSRLTEVWLIKR